MAVDILSIHPVRYIPCEEAEPMCHQDTATQNTAAPASRTTEVRSWEGDPEGWSPLLVKETTKTWHERPECCEGNDGHIGLYPATTEQSIRANPEWTYQNWRLSRGTSSNIMPGATLPDNQTAERYWEKYKRDDYKGKTWPSFKTKRRLIEKYWNPNYYHKTITDQATIYWNNSRGSRRETSKKHILDRHR